MVLDLSDRSTRVVQRVLQCNTSLRILLGVHSLTASLPRSCLCHKGVCVIALHSERRCQLRDKSGRQTLPPVVIETRKLECRRRDSSNSGVTQSSCPNRAGNRLERRQRERERRERLRDNKTVAQILANSLNPIEDGSDSRTLAIVGQLQSLQQIFKSNDDEGSINRTKKVSPGYVGIIPQSSDRSGNFEEIDNDKKRGDIKEGKEKKKLVRIVDDGLLMVVSARIYGRKIRTLIDSGATRCFVSPSCVATCGLKGIPRDVFLELGNGEKILFRGYIPDIPVVTAGPTVKTGLTVTNLLHDVDLVLGMNWLQLVNPVIDWCGGKLYIPNAVHTALLQGSWLENYIKVGTVTVLSSEE